VTAFVLVHGAWHGAWCWDELVPLLPGHVEAVDLPGHGADRTPVAACTLDAYVTRVVEALERAPEPAVLVGHSLGGITVAQAVEQRPELVRTAVFLAAYMPRDGESGYGLARLDTASAITPDCCVMRAADGLLDLLPERIRGALYDGCPTALADAAIARLCAEPLQPMGTPVTLTPERFGSVDRVYALCRRDRIVTPALQRQLVKAQPCRVVELDAGHSPFLSSPRELATAVLTPV
jgi:pimeloyl-ACP methyl ester carboxylesterase